MGNDGRFPVLPSHVLLFALVFAAGCRTTSEYTAPHASTPELTYQAIVADGQRGVAKEDEALWACELGTAAMMVGREEEAWKAFHLASGTMGTLESSGTEARRAILGEEATKRWKGDPHERCMAAYYKGILYWRRGELDNAAACFKSGLLADSYSSVGEHQVDFAALSFLLGWVSWVRGSDEQARYSFREAAEHAPHNLLFDDPEPQDHNVLALLEIGQGPRKVRTGSYGSIARYEELPCVARAVEIRVDGVSQGVSAKATDIFEQAMTRGTKRIDGIRKGKAIFKVTATTTGIVLIDKGARENDSGLMIAGAGALLAGALTNPTADIRHWTLLPAEIHVLPLRMAPGVHEVEVLALDEEHRPIPGWSRTFQTTVGPRPGQLWWFRAQPGLTIHGLLGPERREQS
jgi:tetratricopeptide (TPR) repeat protein